MVSVLWCREKREKRSEGQNVGFKNRKRLSILHADSKNAPESYVIVLRDYGSGLA